MPKISQFKRAMFSMMMVLGLFFVLISIGNVFAEGPDEDTEAADASTMPHVLEPVGNNFDEFIREEGCEALYALPQSQLENSLTNKNIKTIAQECPDFVQSMEVPSEVGEITEVPDNTRMSRGYGNRINWSPPSSRNWSIWVDQWGWRGHLGNWGWHRVNITARTSGNYWGQHRVPFSGLRQGYYRVRASSNGGSHYTCGSTIRWSWSNNSSTTRRC